MSVSYHQRGFSRAILALGLLAAAMLSGCQLIAFAAASAERTGSREVPAEYTGLSNKSFAMVVLADRVIQGEHAGLTDRVLTRSSQMIAQATDASAYIDPGTMRSWLYANPRWRVMTPSEVAEELGVQRLIYVEVIEYRLHEPGNQYLWEGSATATVSVVEADSGFPDDYAFETSVSVAFPDSTGMSPADISEAVVTSELSRRLTDRIAWLFFDHEEPNAITY
jgi:hypothetical protein